MQNSDRRVFFIDTEGKEHCNAEFSNHEQLAEWIVANDGELKEKFEKSRMKIEIAFLMHEGWIYGTESDRYKEVVCLARNISKESKMLIQYYYEEGYKPYDIEKIYGEESLKEFFGKIEEEKEQKQSKQEELER